MKTGFPNEFGAQRALLADAMLVSMVSSVVAMVTKAVAMVTKAVAMVTKISIMVTQAVA